MPLNYILSQRNQKLLIHNNYVHKKEKNGDDKIIWKCNDYKQFSCRGRVHTRDETVIKYIEHTNHVPDIANIKRREYMNDLKKVAKTSQLSTHAVIGSVVSKVKTL